MKCLNCVIDNTLTDKKIQEVADLIYSDIREEDIDGVYKILNTLGWKEKDLDKIDIHLSKYLNADIQTMRYEAYMNDQSNYGGV
jgi:hypothetical protein